MTIIQNCTPHTQTSKPAEGQLLVLTELIKAVIINAESISKIAEALKGQNVYGIYVADSKQED